MAKFQGQNASYRTFPLRQSVFWMLGLYRTRGPLNRAGWQDAAPGLGFIAHALSSRFYIHDALSSGLFSGLASAVADSLADLWESLGAKQQQGNHQNKEQVPRLKKTFTHKTSKPDALPAARRRQKYFASVLQLDLAKATPSHPG